MQSSAAVTWQLCGSRESPLNQWWRSHWDWGCIVQSTVCVQGSVCLLAKQRPWRCSYQGRCPRTSCQLAPEAPGGFAAAMGAIGGITFPKSSLRQDRALGPGGAVNGALGSGSGGARFQVSPCAHLWMQLLWPVVLKACTCACCVAGEHFCWMPASQTCICAGLTCPLVLGGELCHSIRTFPKTSGSGQPCTVLAGVLHPTDMYFPMCVFQVVMSLTATPAHAAPLLLDCCSTGRRAWGGPPSLGACCLSRLTSSGAAPGATTATTTPTGEGCKLCDSQKKWRSKQLKDDMNSS
jgi:hypothetical protein